MGWANLVTLARGGLTLALWAILAVAAPTPSPTTWWATFVLFVVAALTDMVDGALARRLQEVTTFGRVADPIVDKLLVIGTLTVLLGIPALRETLPAWTVAAILTREIVVTSLRGAVEGRGIPFGAVASGKAKMVLQCIEVGALLFLGTGALPIGDPIPALDFLPGGAARWTIAHLAVWASTIVTVLTGVPYVLRASALLRGR